MAGRPGWAQGPPSGDPHAQLWLLFRDGRDADPLSLPAIADAAFPAVMEIGGPGSSTLELTAHVRARPAPGWLAYRSSTRYVIDGYHEEDLEIWDSRGMLVAPCRQLALLPSSWRTRDIADPLPARPWRSRRRADCSDGDIVEDLAVAVGRCARRCAATMVRWTPGAAAAILSHEPTGRCCDDARRGDARLGRHVSRADPSTWSPGIRLVVSRRTHPAVSRGSRRCDAPRSRS